MFHVGFMVLSDRISHRSFGRYEKCSPTQTLYTIAVMHHIVSLGTRLMVKGKSRAKGEPCDQFTTEGRSASIISFHRTNSYLPSFSRSVLSPTNICKHLNRRKPQTTLRIKTKHSFSKLKTETVPLCD